MEFVHKFMGVKLVKKLRCVFHLHNVKIKTASFTNGKNTQDCTSVVQLKILQESNIRDFVFLQLYKLNHCMLTFGSVKY